MLRKDLKKFSCLGTVVLILVLTGNLYALTFDNGLYQSSPQRSHTPQRFGYMSRPNLLPTAKKEKPCVALGQARCFKQQHTQSMLPKSRYSNRLAEQNNVHPLLRRNYKYKTTQNF